MRASWQERAGSHFNSSGDLVAARRDVAFADHVSRSRTKSPPRRNPPGLAAPIAERPHHVSRSGNPKVFNLEKGYDVALQGPQQHLVMPWFNARSPPSSPKARARVVSWDSTSTPYSTSGVSTSTRNPSHPAAPMLTMNQYQQQYGYQGTSQCSPAPSLQVQKRERRRDREAREQLARLRVRYNTLSPSTRKFMINSLERVDRIAERIAIRQLSRFFTLWRCKIMYEQAAAAAAAALQESFYYQGPGLAQQHGRSQYSEYSEHQQGAHWAPAQSRRHHFPSADFNEAGTAIPAGENLPPGQYHHHYHHHHYESDDQQPMQLPRRRKSKSQNPLVAPKLQRDESTSYVEGNSADTEVSPVGSISSTEDMNTELQQCKHMTHKSRKLDQHPVGKDINCETKQAEQIRTENPTPSEREISTKSKADEPATRKVDPLLGNINLNNKIINEESPSLSSPTSFEDDQAGHRAQRQKPRKSRNEIHQGTAQDDSTNPQKLFTLECSGHKKLKSRTGTDTYKVPRTFECEADLASSTSSIESPSPADAATLFKNQKIKEHKSRESRLHRRHKECEKTEETPRSSHSDNVKSTENEDSKPRKSKKLISDENFAQCSSDSVPSPRSKHESEQNKRSHRRKLPQGLTVTTSNHTHSKGRQETIISANSMWSDNEVDNSSISSMASPPGTQHLTVSQSRTNKLHTSSKDVVEEEEEEEKHESTNSRGRRKDYKRHDREKQKGIKSTDNSSLRKAGRSNSLVDNSPAASVLNSPDISFLQKSGTSRNEDNVQQSQTSKQGLQVDDTVLSSGSLFSPSVLQQKKQHLGVRMLQTVLSRVLSIRMQRAFVKWISKVTVAKQDKRLMRRIVNRWGHRTIFEAFRRWKDATRWSSALVVAPFLDRRPTSPSAVRRKEILYRRVVLRACNRHLSGAFQKWARMVVQARYEFTIESQRHAHAVSSMRMVMLRIHHQNLTRAFSCWRGATMISQKSENVERTHGWQGSILRHILLRMQRRIERRTFAHWLRSTNIKAARKNALRKTLLRLAHLRMDSAFTCWCDNVVDLRVNHVRNLFVQSVLRRRFAIVLRQAFRYWKTSTCNESREVALRKRLMAMALRRLGHASLSRGFQTWKQVCHREIVSSTRSICVRFFSWKLALAEAQNQYNIQAARQSAKLVRVKRILSILIHRKQHAAWNKWKQVTNKTARMMSILQRFKKHRLRSMFIHWSSATKAKAGALNSLQRIYEKYRQKTLHRAMHIWQTMTRKAAALDHQDRIMNYAAIRFLQSSQQRCFWAWREFIRREKQDRSHEAAMETLTNDFIATQSRRKLRSILQIWHRTLSRNKKRVRILREWVRRTKLLKITWAWQKWALASTVMTQLATQASAYEEVLLQRKTQLKHAQTKVLDQAKDRFKTKRTALAFQKWTSLVQRKHLIQETIEKMQVKSLHARFHTWRHSVELLQITRMRQAFLSWAKHVYTRRVLAVFHRRSRTKRGLMAHFMAWKLLLREQRRVCRRMCAFVWRRRLQEALSKLRTRAMEARARDLREENIILTFVNRTWSTQQQLRTFFIEWARVAKHRRNVEVLCLYKKHTAMKRLRGVLDYKCKKQRATSFAKRCIVRHVFTAWHRHVSIVNQIEDMDYSRRRHHLQLSIDTWRRYAVVSRAHRVHQHAGLICLSAVINRWQTVQTRRYFTALARWAFCARETRRLVMIYERSLIRYKQRAFLLWYSRTLCINMAVLRVRNNKLRQMCLRSKYAARVAEQELQRTQAKTQTLQVKVDRLLCRNNPRTERERLAEEQYYARKGPDAGRASPLPARTKKLTPRKKHTKRPNSPMKLSAAERAALHGSLSWVPPSQSPRRYRGAHFDEQLVLKDLDTSSSQMNHSRENIIMRDLPLSPLYRSDRELEELEDSLRGEVRDLSNSYGAVSHAAASAKAAGFRGETFEPALEGLVQRILRKEEQLQHVDKSRRSIFESMDWGSEDEDIISEI